MTWLWEGFESLRDSGLVLALGLLVAVPVWIAALAFYAYDWFMIVWWGFVRVLFP